MSDVANPFEPPKSDWDRPVERAEEGIDYFVSASQGARFTNCVIDTVIISVLIVVSGDDGWSFPISIGYYLFFEWLFGKTPGKWITQTKVITKTGRRPRFLQIFGRTLTRFIPFEAFSFFGRKGRGWHDTWSSTRVVREPERQKRRRRRER